jgi:transposase, IS5 family
MTSEVHEKGYRTHPLTDSQKASNRFKSTFRARVEHIFGYMTNSMDAMPIDTIGILQAAANTGLMNLTYNLMRCVQLKNKIYAVMG